MDAAMEQQTYWTAKQNLALSMVKAGHNVYIGGQAGCGKSTLVTHIMQWAENERKSVALTCTTGVACSNFSPVLKPMTIHKWCGVGDGRMCGIKLRGMMATDDRLIPARNRILSTDILIIDEISMFSRRMFDMLETVLRIKDTSHTFGNIQIIVVGDFLQLPPVRNLRYEDLGEFAFTSKFWPPHSIFLDSVFRQRDESLISLIRELSLGQLSNDSQKLITSLARELPQEDGQLVKLYATNILVDLHNRSRIMDLDGQMYSFQSTDKGDERALNTLVVPPTLWLKIGCRVMLLKNLSDRLMNGLQGEVRDIREDAVHVFFPMLHEVATILRCAFTIFDPTTGHNICERYQFPLKLSYGMTIHKSQGMSLDRVEVNCRHIFQSGQLGVAIGRARSIEGLRIVNFSQDAVIPQTQAVTDFVAQEGSPFIDDCSCCRNLVDCLYPEMQQSNPSPVQHATGILDTEDDMDDPVFDELLANIGSSLAEHTAVVLPDTFDLEEQINELSYTCPVTEQQSMVNEIFASFMANEQIVRCFLNQQYDRCIKFYAQTVISEPGRESPVPQCQLTAFYKLWQSHMTSAEYESECLPLILLSSKGTKPALYSAIFKLCTTVRQLLLSDKAAQLSYIDNQKMTSRATDGFDATARGKIRYIGGYAVAKLKYNYMCQVKSNMYKTSALGVSKFNTASVMVEFLEKMTVSEHHLIAVTEDPGSLSETSRKQNINRGLTNISDQCYHCFESIVTASLNELSSKNLVKHGNSLHDHVIKTLEENNQFFASFYKMCSGNNANPASNDNIRTLYRECIYKVSSILLKQFSRDFMESCNTRKKMEHRKQIQVSEKKTAHNTHFKQTKSLNPISITTTEQPGTSGVSSKKRSSSTHSNHTFLGALASSEQPGSSGVSCKKKSLKTQTAVKKTKRAASQEKTEKPPENDDGDEEREEEEEESCYKCGKAYTENEEWIACDICNKWYHRRCCGLSSLTKWKYYTKVNRKFCCPECE